MKWIVILGIIGWVAILADDINIRNKLNKTMLVNKQAFRLMDKLARERDSLSGVLKKLPPFMFHLIPEDSTSGIYLGGDAQSIIHLWDDSAETTTKIYYSDNATGILNISNPKDRLLKSMKDTTHIFISKPWK